MTVPVEWPASRWGNGWQGDSDAMVLGDYIILWDEIVIGNVIIIKVDAKI